MQRKAYRLLAEGWSWIEVAFELAVPASQLKRESRETNPRRRLEGHQKHGRRPCGLLISPAGNSVAGR
jgi:hypothetical protein